MERFGGGQLYQDDLKEINLGQKKKNIGEDETQKEEQ